MGCVHAYWEGAGRISSSGDTAVDRADATLEQERDMDIPLHEGGDGGGGTAGYRNLRHLSPKH